MRAAERPEREGERGQQAVDAAPAPVRPAWTAGTIGSGTIAAKADASGERQDRAQHHADDAADQRQQHHLRQIDGEHAPPAGAERLQRGDGVAPAVEMALDRVADADAADQQRGQADNGEELREALDIALELRRGIAAAADFPAGLRQLRARRARHRLGGVVARVALRQAQAISPAHQAARLQQAGGAQGRLAHHQPRPEADAAGELVRLAGERGADVERGIADGEPRARLEAEALHQGRVGDRAIDAVALRERVGERLCRIELGLAEQRIGAVDRLDFDQRGAAVVRARHGAQRGGGRNVAVAFQEGHFRRRGFALDQAEGQVAAENDAALARQSVGQARGQRADAGDRHGAERDAGDEDVEAAQARAHFAQREAQREPAVIAGDRRWRL